LEDRLLKTQHPETHRDGDETVQGTVVRKSQGFYGVDVDGRTIQCALSNKLRKQLVYPIADPASIRRRVVAVEEIRSVDPVAIGDVVRFVDAGDGSGLINEVLPRANKLVRRAAGPKPLEQVIVANVDQVVCVFAATFPEPKWELLDRYLAAAESQELPAIICITKVDLADSEALAEEVGNYRQIGYPVILTSAVTGTGLDEALQVLQGRASVLMGKSGVGKTSLLNALQPGLGLRVNAVSQITGKGKHTTTHLEMFGLEGGGRIVDTPGMREFALWDVGDVELAETFPEMRPFLGTCRFGASCQHDAGASGCAIKAAVQRGAISARRYESYLRLRID
jgi:ribosome biogenesis GTPase